MAQKQFKDLDLKDAFLFAAALEDPETCRLVLELILGKKLSGVKVRVEHSILYSSDYRSIRLDVYASDEVQVGYNLEMQNSDKGELPKRSRFHQAEMDVEVLKPGESFRDLKPSYVIFICTFDPFDRGLYRYTFVNYCQEEGFVLGDGACKIFLNTKGENAKDVPTELVEFLRYVEASTEESVGKSKDRRIGELHSRISSLKKSKRWEARYMTFGDLLDRTKEEAEKVGEKRGEKRGEELGEKHGEKRILTLFRHLQEDGKEDLIFRLGDDEALKEELFAKYNL